jgi:hypothetical protein
VIAFWVDTSLVGLVRAAMLIVQSPIWTLNDMVDTIQDGYKNRYNIVLTTDELSFLAGSKIYQCSNLLYTAAQPHIKSCGNQVSDFWGISCQFIGFN